jgi:polar amino acid transport system substrate-binding protein
MPKFLTRSVTRRLGTYLALLAFAAGSVPLLLVSSSPHFSQTSAYIAAASVVLLATLIALILGRHISVVVEQIRKALSELKKSNADVERGHGKDQFLEDVIDELDATVERICESTSLKKQIDVMDDKLNRAREQISHERMERQAFERTGLDLQSMLNSIVESLPDAAIVIDREHRVLVWNHAMEKLTGVSAAEMLGKNNYHYSVPIYGEQRPLLADAVLEPSLLADDLFREVKNSTGRLVSETLLQGFHSKGRYVRSTAAPVCNSSGNVVGAIEIMHDITEDKLCREKLRHLAFKDQLTGLPNRLVFGDRLSQEIGRAYERSQMLAVIMLDIDRLKLVNESLGHSLGDKLIKVMSERLASVTRDGDVLARMGGDEFALLLTGLHNVEQAASIADRLLGELARPVNVDDLELRLTASAGITIFPEHGLDSETLVKNADAALYQAKEAGGNTYSIYTHSLHTQVLEKMRLEHDLRRAIELGEFRLHFQPRVNLATGSVVAVEALIRWQHPDLGLLYPGHFISIAEEAGLIAPITRWVMSSVCQQLAQWHDQASKSIVASVNVSASDIHKPDFIDTVKQILHSTGVKPHFLELELTEATFVQSPDDVARALAELKGMGIRIAVDDFGTGYSSLGYLKNLPIDVLKIDQSFVQDITTDNYTAAITRAVITLAHSLNLLVVAEGVETREQLDVLQEWGCDEIQGYFIGQPVPAEQLFDSIGYGLPYEWIDEFAA